MYSDGAVVIDIRANQTDFDNKVKNLEIGRAHV